ncbi:MAG: extracellular solute-binding protein [Spirochaetales bacterium]|nr:extracellular solute-binding protein [Spirochaetales bacterium]
MTKVKSILVILLLVVFSASIFGAGKQEAKKEKIVLKYYQYKPEIVDPLDKLVGIFHDQNPNITVNIETVGKDYLTVLKTKIASNDIPDIYAVQGAANMKSYVNEGILADLTNESFMARVADGAKPAVTYKGKVYALPMDMAGLGIIYNKDLFKKAGISAPPKTVSELKDAVKKLKAIGVIPFGVAFKEAWTLRHMFSMGHAATVMPIKFADDMNAGKTHFWNSQMNKVFETFDLIKANCNSKPFESNYTNETTMFAQGKTAMMTQGLWAMKNVRKVNPDINAGMFGLPVFEDPSKARLMVDVDYRIGVNAKSKNVEAAKKFLDFMTTKTATEIWIKDCKLISSIKGTSVDAIGSPVATDIKHYIDTDKTYPWGYAYWAAGLTSKIGPLMQEYYLGKLTKEQVCSTMDELWAKAISK